METTDYGRCDPAFHIERLRCEGELLADLAAAAGLDAPLPSCPGWQVRDLLKHLGYVHRWAAGYVGEELEHWRDRWSEQEILSQGPDDAELPGWFREGHAGLVRTLQAADPAVTCWTFLDAPSPLAFWARRQAHETAIHRVDAAQAAAGGVGAGEPAAGEPAAGEPAAGIAALAAGAEFSPRFAADGIDEVIMGFLGREARRGSWQGSLGSLGIHADDGTAGSAHWHIVSEPGRFAVSRGTGPADCDVTGPAAALYLLLWNRAAAGGLKVSGDADVLARFRNEVRMTWS